MIEGRCLAASESPVVVDPVAHAVMVNTVDRFDVSRDADHNVFRLTKRTPGPDV